MKRTNLIEYTLIVIAAIFGYKFFETLFGLVVQVVTGLSIGGIEIAEIFIPLLLIAGAYLLVFVVLIRKSRDIAVYLNANNPEEIVPFTIGKKALLHLIILGISLTTILYALPDLLIFLYESLKTKKNQGLLSDNTGLSFERNEMVSKIVRLLVAVVVLATSKEITHWFLKNDGKDELILEADDKDDTANT